jgi:hypothetical protein
MIVSLPKTQKMDNVNVLIIEDTRERIVKSAFNNMQFWLVRAHFNEVGCFI